MTFNLTLPPAMVERATLALERIALALDRLSPPVTQATLDQLSSADPPAAGAHLSVTPETLAEEEDRLGQIFSEEDWYDLGQGTHTWEEIAERAEKRQRQSGHVSSGTRG